MRHTTSMFVFALRHGPAFAVLAVALGGSATRAAFVTFSASGSNAAAIQATVDAFRTDLGSLNANVPGSFGSGRREINWDGVPNALAAPNNLPADFFNVNSPRGVIFSTPGSGFQVSANAGVAPILFGNINPTYPSIFTAFSAQRLFTAVGSNVVDVNFFIAGTSTPALTHAFGAVFTDVDLANTTSIQYFDQANNSLGTFFAANATGDQTLSFLGVSFDSSLVSRVRITNGNQALGGNSTGDVVAMDDFIYAEPVPEPSGFVLAALGMGGLALASHRRGRNGSS